MNTFQFRLKYILVGASGTGKTTMAHILEEELGLKRCITSTTRPPRPGEKDGIDYHFRSELKPEEMFEYVRFGGYEYGITYHELSRGDFVILEPQGVQYYREHYPAPLTVIQLQRSNIDVDAERMARDKAAGFDCVNPDIVVSGDTIDTMAANLLGVIESYESRHQNLDVLISEAMQKRTAFSYSDNCTGPERYAGR